MKPALSILHGPSPVSWQDFPHGVFLQREVERKVQQWLPQIFGYHLLKLGPLSSELATDKCCIKHQINVVPQQGPAGVVAEIDELPFAQHSVDACILSHSLEYHEDPHHILREIHRVLLPGGYLILTGFNPISFCGMARMMPFSRAKLPWSGRFFTPARVKDWLHLLGFELIDDQRFIHASLARGSRFSRSGRWRKFCKHYLRPMGSVYMIVARKRVTPLTPIKPKWHARPQFSAVKSPSMRAQAQRKSSD